MSLPSLLGVPCFYCIGNRAGPQKPVLNDFGAEGDPSWGSEVRPAMPVGMFEIQECSGMFENIWSWDKT